MSNLWIIPVAMVLIVTVIALLMVRIGSLFRATLQAVATELGLTWRETGTFGPGEVSGEFHGQAVTVFTHQQGVGSMSRLLTVVEVTFNPPIAIPFRLEHENVISRIAKLLGRRDLEFGDPEFDRLYLVKTEHPEQVRKLFNATTRAALVTMAKGSVDFDVNPDRIRWEHSGRVGKASTIVRVVKAGVAAAASMRAAIPRASRDPSLY